MIEKSDLFSLLKKKTTHNMNLCNHELKQTQT